MASGERIVQVYEDLADWHDRHGQLQKRDRFLLLAADAALSAGDATEAERLRGRLLEQNPHHLLRPYRSLTEALQSPDVRNYLADLRQTHRPEDARRLWHSLSKEDTVPKPDHSSRPLGRDGDQPALDSSRGVADSLKVYRVKIEEESLPPRPMSSSPARLPSRTPASPSASSSARPIRTETRRPGDLPKFEADTNPHASAPTLPAPAPEDDAEDSAWVLTLLFWLVLSGGLLLAGYVLVKQFWPA